MPFGCCTSCAVMASNLKEVPATVSHGAKQKQQRCPKKIQKQEMRVRTVITVKNKAVITFFLTYSILWADKFLWAPEVLSSCEKPGPWPCALQLLGETGEPDVVSYGAVAVINVTRLDRSGMFETSEVNLWSSFSNCKMK